MNITTLEEEKELEKLQAEKPKKVEVKKQEKKSIPLGYIKVKLDSLGKLSAPFELHFRDYSMEEVLELANTNDDIDNLEAVIKVLNNMVFEDFDCGDFTLEELMEVLYTIQGSFYSASIEKRVMIDETKNPQDESNWTYAEISIGDISTKELSEEFKEPFTLTDSKTKQKFTFRLPRVKDKITAEMYLRDKFKTESRKFSSIHYEIQKIERIKDKSIREERFKILEDERFDEMRAFQEYALEKSKLLLVLIQGLSLLSVDGKAIEYGDCDKLIEVIPTISRRVWETFTEVIEKYDFGLDNNVTFYLPEADKKVTRRLPFQRVDFLPDNDKESSTGVSISFES